MGKSQQIDRTLEVRVMKIADGQSCRGGNARQGADEPETVRGHYGTVSRWAVPEHGVSDTIVDTNYS